LTGPHWDQVVRVCDVYQQFHHVRVELGEEARNKGADVFAYYAICREEDGAGPSG
jgi:uncharacterized protein YciU (UPF0263 family)